MPQRILRLRDVVARCGLARSTIYLMMHRGTFPRPLRLSPGTVGWREADLDEWLASRERSTGWGAKA